MSIKSPFLISTSHKNSDDATISPFWVRDMNKPAKAWKYAKIAFRFLKLAILIFFVTMGLWGCIQMSADHTVKSSTTIGQGMEFGFAYGTTGNYLFDVGSSSTNGYYIFSSFNFNYGPFFAIFVYPFAILSLAIMWACRNWWGGMNALLAIILILVIIRGATLLITIRSSLQSEKQAEAQGKIAEINAKYKGMKDMASQQLKSKEISEVYKKYKIKPFAVFEQSLITIPVYMIIFRVINMLRPLKATNLFNVWSFVATPTTEIFSNFTNGGWVYIFILLLILPVQIFSIHLPKMWAKKRSRDASAISKRGNKEQKFGKIMQIVMVCVVCGFVVFSPTGVGVYYLFSSLWTIGQSYLLHHLILNNRKHNGSLEKRLEALGLE